MAGPIENYYEYFDKMSFCELEEELHSIENSYLDITGDNYHIDNSYKKALYDYLIDIGYFI